MNLVQKSICKLLLVITEKLLRNFITIFSETFRFSKILGIRKCLPFIDLCKLTVIQMFSIGAKNVFVTIGQFLLMLLFDVCVIF